MNYYVEMIKDFVMAEIKKTNGKFLDDGEYVFACGMAFLKLTAKERKSIVVKKRMILSEIKTFLLLSVELRSFIREYAHEVEKFTIEDKNLIRMITEYKPVADELDAVMIDVMQEALNMPKVNNRYERQERYHNKVGLVSKTYKLNKKVVDDFAQACIKQGVSMGPTLTELMIEYIDRVNQKDC